MTMIIDHGQIKRLVLPDDWLEHTADSGSANLREFQPTGRQDVRLCLYYRGLPMSTESGGAFKNILHAEKHFLSLDELEAIGELLEDSGDIDLFQPQAIQTSDIGDRRVLVVEGRWLEQGWDTYSLFVSCDETGCVVQQIYFLAPTVQYTGLLPLVKQILESIEWKESDPVINKDEV
jgi:hypothetical protein